MERGMLVYLVVALCCTVHSTYAYIEIIEEYGCQDNEFRLTCRHLDAHIAVLEGLFYPEDTASNGSCGSLNRTDLEINNTLATGGGENTVRPSESDIFFSTTSTTETPVTNRNIRLALNRRCSGVNHCSFVLSYDVAGGAKWGPGLVAFKYACVAAQRVTKFCNVDISLNSTLNEGFIQSPGFPKFYVGVGDAECRWKISAAPGQRIEVTLMDISLRSLGPNESRCTDTLSVLEENRTIFSTCREHQQLVSFLSASAAMEVVLEIKSKIVIPKRGVLFHYKGIGCPTPRAPTDGYLVRRNDTVAEYMCCVGFAFPDTLRRARQVLCRGGHYWHDTVPDCINVNATHDTNTSVVATITPRPEKSKKMSHESSTLYDVVIPTGLIAALFVVNAFIVLFIHKYRKRKLQRSPEEELAVICADDSTPVA